MCPCSWGNTLVTIIHTLSTDNLPCHFVSAFGAGFVTTVIASPVDVVKTRYMNSPSGQYKSAINCAWTMLTKEGPTAFYKGWALYLCPRHTLVCTQGHLIKVIRHCYICSLLSFIFSVGLCRRFWGWDRGTLWCLSHSSKLREPWWSRGRRLMPTNDYLTENLNRSWVGTEENHITFS